MKKIIIPVCVCLIAALTFSGCNPPEETTELGEVPGTSEFIEYTDATTTEDNETTAPTEPEPDDPEETTEEYAEGDSGIPNLPTPEEPLPEFGPLPTEPEPVVDYNPAPTTVKLDNSFDNSQLNLTLKMPNGFSQIDGTSRTARFRSETGDQEFTLFMFYNKPSGGKMNNIRVNFSNTRELLFYNIGDLEYSVWDMTIRDTENGLTSGDITYTLDRLDIELVEKENYTNYKPSADVAYFDLGSHSYALLGLSSFEDKLVMQKYLTSIISSIKPVGTAEVGLFDAGTERVADTKNGVSFELPAGWKRIENYEMIVFRPDVDITSPLFSLQVTCFLGTAKYKVSYEAPYSIPDVIANSYREEPLILSNKVNGEVTVTSYADIPFKFLHRSLNMYVLETRFRVLSAEHATYIPDGGIVNSLMYTFDTKSGDPYSINISASNLNNTQRKELADLIADTLILE